MLDIFIATNNGDMGGGEVMLLNIARAVRQLGHKVTVVGPSFPAELIEAAQDEGFPVIVLPATNRKQYMIQLRLWSARRKSSEILWCNGLVPSFTTVGQKNRIVHLHQIPEGLHKYLAVLAKRKALKILAPSIFASTRIAGSEPFYNWVSSVNRTRNKTFGSPIRVGFLGRPSDFKGTQFVAQAVSLLNREAGSAKFQLVIGGESRFVPDNETQELKPALEDLGDSLVELGWTTPEHYFSEIDIATVPSNWDEVFGLVAAESMSAQVPLIVSDAGALPEVVGENYPYIVPQANVLHLATTIAAVATELQEDSPLLEESIKQAFWRWQEYFSPMAGKIRVEKLLKSLEQ